MKPPTAVDFFAIAIVAAAVIWVGWMHDVSYTITIGSQVGDSPPFEHSYDEQFSTESKVLFTAQPAFIIAGLLIVVMDKVARRRRVVRK